MGDLGTSTTGLVGGAGPARLPQYINALAVTIGPMSFGATLAYTSFASPMLMGETNATDCGGTELTITEAQNNWFSSILNVGALVGGLVGGIFANILGRKGTMLASILLILGGWLLIGLGQNYAMLVTGRVLSGLFVGITCIVVPTYIGEYASADIRGTLGSGFQLMVTFGILYGYVVGSIMDCWRAYAWVSAIPFVLYAILVFLFVPESPAYLLTKGQTEAARATLQRFRGEHYNVEPELQVLRDSQEEAKRNKVALRDLNQPYIIKPLVIVVMLMVFQQFSGINAVIFNLATIFKDAGSDMSEGSSTIVVGLVQFLATFVAGGLVDKAGRKLLLTVSAAAMCLSLVALDVFFYEKSKDQEWALDHLGWLPLTSLIIFIAAFSIGYGPIPWVMMSELFSANVREASGGIATASNWTCSFLITLSFEPLQSAVGDYGCYWIFAGICAINVAFCLLVVPETKGKTLEEITAYFGAPRTTEDKKIPSVGDERV